MVRTKAYLFTSNLEKNSQDLNWKPIFWRTRNYQRKNKSISKPCDHNSGYCGLIQKTIKWFNTWKPLRGFETWKPSRGHTLQHHTLLYSIRSSYRSYTMHAVFCMETNRKIAMTEVPWTADLLYTVHCTVYSVTFGTWSYNKICSVVRTFATIFCYENSVFSGYNSLIDV